MRRRNARSGLTSIELLLSFGVLAILVAVAMLLRSRQHREQWTAIAAAEPGRVFELTCAPTTPAYKNNAPFTCDCTVTNTGPYPADLHLGSFRFQPETERRAINMTWAITDTPDTAPTRFMQSQVTIALDTGESLAFRLHRHSLFEGPESLPRFGGPIEFTGTIEANIRGGANYTPIESNPLTFLLHPPPPGGTQPPPTTPDPD